MSLLLRQASRSNSIIACARTASTMASSRYLDGPQDAATLETPKNLSAKQKEALSAAVRIDQAGEIAANWIYKGQYAVLSSDPKTGPVVQEMWDQEKKHLAVMDKLQIQHDARPTALTEVAKIAGFGLGFATALMGKEAAMACTEAVETVIGEHYDDQLRDLELMEPLHSSIPLLRDVIREFRDDELEHLNTAVYHHSQRAPHHALLTTIVEGGCQIAIQLCKRF
ncbi:hypothetical protein FRC14_006707 [Serendipita sp. 396]|nr:hypothetical protein FRC14_006707 [Serendipita sp. 396]KAG8788029.1 hypothetical protein FRC15_006593 [Serendipita sp. 397]KAG8870421.1 hypothetical protein FRC20_011855 [Serendipita sp. 405]